MFAFLPRRGTTYQPGVARFGRTPGNRSNGNGTLKGFPISIPIVPLVELHPVFAKHRPKLILKRHALMTRFLTVDVPVKRIRLRRPDRKRSITHLPREIVDPPFVQFQRRPTLLFADQIGDGNRAAKPAMNVDVIRDAANSAGVRLMILANACEVCEYTFSQFAVGQEGSTIFRRIHDVEMDLRQ